MKRSLVLDMYFLDARSKLIELAAFMDRVERSEGDDDYRMNSFRKALGLLAAPGSTRAQQVLRAFSDPTTGAADHAASPAAGTWNGDS